MGRRGRALGALVAAVVVVPLGMLVSAPAASAAAPGFEPDANAQGYVSFYDDTAQLQTGGADLSHLADYVLASTAGRTGATKASLSFAIPDHTTSPSAWTNVPASSATTYPNPSAYNGLRLQTNPLVTLTATDGNLSAALAGRTLDNSPGYAVNVGTAGAPRYEYYIQVRVTDSGTGLAAATTYWATDILVDPAAGTWTVSYPTAAVPTSQPTTLSLAAIPATGATNETDVTFAATISNNSGGVINFFSDGGQIDGTVAVFGHATGYTSPVNLPAGTHTVTAAFTPATAQPYRVGYLSSTASMSYTVTQLVHTTTTSLTVATPVVDGGNGTLRAKAVVTDDASAAVTTGTVQFRIDGVNAGSAAPYDAASSGFSLAVPGSQAGTPCVPKGTACHQLTAVFVPAANPAHQLGASTSPAAAFEVTAPIYKPDPQSVSTAIDPGTITITTPYGGDTGLCAVGTDPSNSAQLGKVYLKSTGAVLTDSTPCGFLFLPAMGLAADASQYSTVGVFDHIQVNDTRPGNNAWTLSAQSSNLNKAGVASPGAPEIINSQNVGLTGLVWDGSNNVSLTAGNYTLSSNPVPAVAVGSGASGTAGLGNAPHAIVHAAVGLGTSVFHGNLTIEAPSSTRDGVYTGTVTFTVLGS